MVEDIAVGLELSPDFADLVGFRVVDLPDEVGVDFVELPDVGSISVLHAVVAVEVVQNVGDLILERGVRLQRHLVSG